VCNDRVPPRQASKRRFLNDANDPFGWSSRLLGWFADQAAWENYGLALASEAEAQAGHLGRARELTKQGSGSLDTARTLRDSTAIGGHKIPTISRRARCGVFASDLNYRHPEEIMPSVQVGANRLRQKVQSR
jgi:hypothetical protein